MNILCESSTKKVMDNYCFVFNGEYVDLDEIMGDNSAFWRNTATTTRYYSSDTLKTFYQV